MRNITTKKQAKALEREFADWKLANPPRRARGQLLFSVARKPIIPLRLRLWGIAISAVIACAGQLYLRGINNGAELALDDCYGMPCTQYTLIIGQASKEARQQKAVPVRVSSLPPEYRQSAFDALGGR